MFRLLEFLKGEFPGKIIVFAVFAGAAAVLWGANIFPEDIHLPPEWAWILWFLCIASAVLILSWAGTEVLRGGPRVLGWARNKLPLSEEEVAILEIIGANSPGKSQKTGVITDRLNEVERKGSKEWSEIEVGRICLSLQRRKIVKVTPYMGYWFVRLTPEGVVEADRILGRKLKERS